jgi:hypothetical protein
MTRILIPRSDNTSAKTIEASDWEKYFDTPVLYDFVTCGLCVSAQCPNILAVDVAAGNARVKGLHLNNSVSCAVTCLTVCATNKIYMTVCRDPSCEPEAWTLGSTTGCIPIDSYQIATATTNGTTVTAVCNVAARITNNQFGFVGTGAELAAICPTYRGMKAFVTASGCGYGIGQTYTRNIANTIWDPEILSFGCGSDCSATNPALNGGESREYTCLTISCNTTWGSCGEGPIVVRVSCTLTICACTTLTLDVTEAITGTLPAGGVAPGGGASYKAGEGGTPAESKATVVILAKTVTGTGTITATGNAGNNGTASVCCAPGSNSASGSPGGSGEAGSGIGHRVLPASGGGSGGTVGNGGTGGNTESIGRYFNLSHLMSQHQYGGAGGAGRAGSGTVNTGGGGGAGASVSLSGGGNGGNSTGNPAAAGSGGGGGGGGGGVSLILITETVSAINICLTGGAGGCGGDSIHASGGGGGGGGGGGASLLLVALTDNTCTTVTGGVGGTAGVSTGTSTSGANGCAGGNTAAYVTTSDWVKYMKRGF